MCVCVHVSELLRDFTPCSGAQLLSDTKLPPHTCAAAVARILRRISRGCFFTAHQAPTLRGPPLPIPPAPLRAFHPPARLTEGRMISRAACHYSRGSSCLVQSPSAAQSGCGERRRVSVRGSWIDIIDTRPVQRPPVHTPATHHRWPASAHGRLHRRYRSTIPTAFASLPRGILDRSRA